MKDLTDVETAFALGDKATLEALQQAAEKFKALERQPAYQEFVKRLKMAVYQLTEDIMFSIGKSDEKELYGMAKFRDGIKFVLDSLSEKLEIWDETTKYIDELEKEEKLAEPGSRVMLPDSAL